MHCNGISSVYHLHEEYHKKSTYFYTIFKLSDMKQKFNMIFTELTNKSIDVYSKRLKEKLIGSIPRLKVHKQCRDIILNTNEISVEVITQVLSSDKKINVMCLSEL